MKDDEREEGPLGEGPERRSCRRTLASGLRREHWRQPVPHHPPQLTLRCRRFHYTRIVFAIGAWLGMMIVVMPMAGAGLFGMKLGPMAPIMTLIVHII
ncbi:MAG: hypothetical protein ABI440_07270 [Casimicrobiaceae bacterium]